MDPKTQKLLTKVEKAGVRQSIKAGHVLDQQELLGIKVQLLPAPVRILTGILAVASGVATFLYWGEWAHAILLLILTVLLLFFTIYGVRRTLSKIVDSWDGNVAADFLSAAGEAIGDSIGSIFEGL